jgi:hypothetical protein
MVSADYMDEECGTRGKRKCTHSVERKTYRKRKSER